MVPLESGAQQVLGPVMGLYIGIIVPVVSTEGSKAIIFGDTIGKTRTIRVTITPYIAQIVLSAKSLSGLEDILHLHKAGIRNRKLVLVGTLGGDEDYTVGTTCTIDCCRSCILQHIDADNLVGRNIGDGSCGEAIDDEEWFVALRNRTATTHTDRSATARTTVLRDNAHTSKFTLQGLRNVRNWVGHKFLCVYRRNRTGEVTLLNGAVTDDNHFVKLVTILLDSDAEFVLAGHGDVLLAIADVSHFERSVFGHVRDTEVTIDVGGSTVGGTHNDDVGADHGLAQLIDYGTGHGLGLGKDERTAEGKCHQ